MVGPLGNWLLLAPLSAVAGLVLAAFFYFRVRALPVHRRLLGAGLVLIENLTALERIGDGDFLLSALPLPISGAEACPVRAIAILPPFL